MNIFFVVTGIGLGHATRVDSIIDELKKRDKNCKITIACYKSSYEYFKNKGYKLIKLNGSNYSSKNFNVNIVNIIRMNLKFPLNLRNDINLLVNEINKINPDYLVVDWEVSGLIAASKTNKKSILIFNYDPLYLQQLINKFKLGRFKVLQSKFVESTYSLAEKKSEAIFIPGLRDYVKDKFHYIPFILRNNPDDFASEDKIIQKLGLKKRPYLVMLGGSNFGYKLMDKLLEVLLEFKDENFIVFGYNKNFKANNVISYKFKSNYLEYLKVSKGVIMMAGHSSFGESAVFKKPILVFPIRGHVEQILNGYTIEEIGIGLVKYLERLNKQEIKDYLKEFIKNKKLFISRLDKLNITDDGAKRVAEFILKKAN